MLSYEVCFLYITLCSEKNRQLENLVHCLTTMLTIQGSGYREIPIPGNSENSAVPLFKKESVMMIRNMFAETIKTLGMYSTPFDPTMHRGKPIMGVQIPPMLESNNPSSKDEEQKVMQNASQQMQKPEWLRLAGEVSDYGNLSPKPWSENMIESMPVASPNPQQNSPIQPSDAAYPSIYPAPDPGMILEQFPDYLSNPEMSPIPLPYTTNPMQRLNSFDAQEKVVDHLTEANGKHEGTVAEKPNLHTEIIKIPEQTALQLYSYALNQQPPTH